MAIEGNWYLTPLRLDYANQAVLPMKAGADDIQGRGIDLFITRDGKPMDTTGCKVILIWRHLRIEGAEGSKEFTAVDASKGHYTIEYSDAMLHPGNVMARVLVWLGDSQITSSRIFDINVDKNIIRDEDALQDTDFRMFLAALDGLQKIEVDAKDAIAKANASADKADAAASAATTEASKATSAASSANAAATSANGAAAAALRAKNQVEEAMQGFDTITGTEIAYAAGTSATQAPQSGWSIAPKEVTQGQYLWSRITTHYSNAEDTVVYAVARQGVDGKNGADGKDGVNGKDGKDGFTDSLDGLFWLYIDEQEGDLHVVSEGDTPNLEIVGNDLIWHAEH